MEKEERRYARCGGAILLYGLKDEVPKGEFRISGRFDYTTKRKFLKAYRAKTESYVDDERRSGARLCVKCFQDDV